MQIQSPDFYKIPLEQSSNKTHRIISFFILLMHALFFGYFYLQATNYTALLLAGCIINSINLVMILFPRYAMKKLNIFFPFTLICNAVIWILLGNIFMILLMVVLLIMNFYNQKKPIVIFSDAMITYPSFPAKKFLWQDVESLIIKDDVLSIDLKNNTLIQQKIESHYSDQFDIMAFNAFVKSKLVAS